MLAGRALPGVFNWNLVGCFPYIKYHCTKRPVQDLSAENRLRFVNLMSKRVDSSLLGIPCVLYGIAAIALIKHTETIEDEQTKKIVRIHFLIKEDHN
ncbi:hypothetical protein COOONC_24258 [Cooperia oncophora]